MKKAQFEIMGLAIIVILVSLMIFFAVLWGMQERDDVTGQFLEEQFAQNLIDATLKTSLEECRGTVADYLISQGTENPLRPMGGLPADVSCATDEGLQEIADALESVVVDYYGRPYYLEIRPRTCELFAQDCDTLIEQGTCDITEHVGRPGRQPLSLYPQSGTMEIILWVC